MDLGPFSCFQIETVNCFSLALVPSLNKSSSIDYLRKPPMASHFTQATVYNYRKPDSSHDEK